MNNSINLSKTPKLFTPPISHSVYRFKMTRLVANLLLSLSLSVCLCLCLCLSLSLSLSLVSFCLHNQSWLPSLSLRHIIFPLFRNLHYYKTYDGLQQSRVEKRAKFWWSTRRRLPKFVLASFRRN